MSALSQKPTLAPFLDILDGELRFFAGGAGNQVHCSLMLSR
jgi:hypothetical protein